MVTIRAKYRGSSISDEENYEKMTCLDLRQLLRERKLPVGGRKAQLIARLKDYNKKEEPVNTDDDISITSRSKKKLRFSNESNDSSSSIDSKKGIRSLKPDTKISHRKRYWKHQFIVMTVRLRQIARGALNQPKKINNGV